MGQNEREKTKSSILFSHIPCQYNWMKTLLLLVLESRERESIRDGNKTYRLLTSLCNM